MANISEMEPVLLKVTDKTHWLFVKIVTDDGFTGIGEATLAREYLQIAACIRKLAQQMKGCSSESINAFESLFAVDRGGLPQRAAASAAEQALWDIAGKRLNRPVHALLGGAVRDRIPVYANINRGTLDRTPKGFAEKARKAVDSGFGYVKISPFGGMGSEDALADTQALDQGMERIRAVVDALGNKAKLMIDCHELFDEFQALEMLGKVADFRPYWVESPVREENIRLKGLQRLRRAADDLGIRFAGLEKKYNLAQFLPYLEAGIYDVIMPDVKYCGGLKALQHIAALAGVYGVTVSPHNPTGPVCHLASIHAAATLDNFLMLEHQFDETPLFYGLGKQDIPRIENGRITVPNSPGLGFELDDAAVQRYEESIQ
jgi:galactonate dehydratase